MSGIELKILISLQAGPEPCAMSRDHPGEHLVDHFAGAVDIDRWRCGDDDAGGDHVRIPEGNHHHDNHQQGHLPPKAGLGLAASGAPKDPTNDDD